MPSKSNKTSKLPITLYGMDGGAVACSARIRQMNMCLCLVCSITVNS